MPSLSRARRQANMTVCMSNMRQIGLAFTMYANESKEYFPYAETRDFRDDPALPDRQACITWDDLLNKQVKGALTASDEAMAVSPRFNKLFWCPEDTIDRVTPYALYRNVPPSPRSYAIPRVAGLDDGHNVGFAGVGSDAYAHAGQTLDQFKICAKRPWFRDSSNTLLLVERPSADNVQGWITTEYCDNPADQVRGYVTNLSLAKNRSFHAGRWNYLFVDGHVEPMHMEDTVRSSGTFYNTITAPASYMWTRNSDD